MTTTQKPMKKTDGNLVGRVMVMAVLAATPLMAQDYSMSWSSLGSGGSGSGGSYALDGVVIETNGVTATSNLYSQTAAYWNPSTAFEIIGSPALAISHSGSEISLTWADNISAVVLDESEDLIVWTVVVQVPALVGQNRVVTVTITQENSRRFYRLRRN
jgi:hypothetical protein